MDQAVLACPALLSLSCRQAWVYIGPAGFLIVAVYAMMVQPSWIHSLWSTLRHMMKGL